MFKPVDSLGNEIKVGDVILYATGSSSNCNLNYGVIEEIIPIKDRYGSKLKKFDAKLKVHKFEKSWGRYDTENGKFALGARRIEGDFIDENIVTLQSICKVVRITEINLPENELRFREMRKRSRELLCGD